MSADTIFALSSGQPPAAIGIIRISGPQAKNALSSLIGSLPEERRASLVNIRHPQTGDILDNALILWFGSPNTATGEDLVELHCHGGRAVVQAVVSALLSIEGLREAEPGEFTRRAFINGRMDLAEAEGLSDLLFAETELQRRSAIKTAGGALSRKIEIWQRSILQLSSAVEAELDFSDEDDVHPAQLDKVHNLARSISQEMEALLDRPRSEKLREGVRVVLGGPPNSGKSTLLNAIVDREAAIVSDIAGTTRDVIEVPVAIAGIPFLFIDTAGVRDDGAEEIERIGIDRARQQFALADLILWLGPEGEGPETENLIELASRSDHPEFQPKSDTAIIISPMIGHGMEDLLTMLLEKAREVIPVEDDVAVNARQAKYLSNAEASLRDIIEETDFLIIGEQLRLARAALDKITGRSSTEDMLDTLFGNFCIGK